jgi:hypothetical protein
VGASGRKVRAASRHGHCFTVARIDATLQPDRQTLTSALPRVRKRIRRIMRANAAVREDGAAIP